MMNQLIVKSALKFLIRRGLTLLGTAGAAVSDDWVAQTASVLIMVGNEAVQWYLAHRAERKKAEVISIFDKAKSS